MTDTNRIKPVKVPKPAPAPRSDMDKLFDLAEKANVDPAVFQRMASLIATEQYAKKAQSWHDAMRACQAEMSAVSKDASNGATGGSKYATLGAVDAALRPIYVKHGFDVTFDTETADETDALGIILTISHEGGHQQTFTIAMPCDGKGAHGKQMMTLTHAAGSATTYGRRYLLCLAFNIATVDDDGNAATAKAAAPAKKPVAPQEKVSDEQAAKLIAMADESGANKRLLCVFLSSRWGLEVPSLSDIPAERFDEVVAQLKIKMSANANK